MDRSRRSQDCSQWNRKMWNEYESYYYFTQVSLTCFKEFPVTGSAWTFVLVPVGNNGKWGRELNAKKFLRDKLSQVQWMSQANIVYNFWSVQSYCFYIHCFQSSNFFYLVSNIHNKKQNHQRKPLELPSTTILIKSIYNFGRLWLLVCPGITFLSQIELPL